MIHSGSDGKDQEWYDFRMALKVIGAGHDYIDAIDERNGLEWRWSLENQEWRRIR